MPLEEIPKARVTDNMLPEGSNETRISGFEETDLSNLDKPLPDSDDEQTVQEPDEGDNPSGSQHDTDLKEETLGQPSVNEEEVFIAPQGSDIVPHPRDRLPPIGTVLTDLLRGDLPQPRIVPEDAFVSTLSSPAAAISLSAKGTTARDLVATMWQYGDTEVNLIHKKLLVSQQDKRTAQAQVAELKRVLDPSKAESALEIGSLNAKAVMVEQLEHHNAELLRNLEKQERKVYDQTRQKDLETLELQQRITNLEEQERKAYRHIHQKDLETEKLQQTIFNLEIALKRSENALEYQQGQIPNSRAREESKSTGTDDLPQASEPDRILKDEIKKLRDRLEQKTKTVEDFRQAREQDRNQMKELRRLNQIEVREKHHRTKQIERFEGMIKERDEQIENQEEVLKHAADRESKLEQRVVSLEMVNAAMTEQSVNSLNNDSAAARHVKRLETELNFAHSEMSDVKQNAERDQNDLGETRSRLSEAEKNIKRLEQEQRVLKGKAALGENANAKAEDASKELARERKEMIGLQEDIVRLIEAKEKLELGREYEIFYEAAYKKANQEIQGQKEQFTQERELHTHARGLVDQQQREIADLERQLNKMREVVSMLEDVQAVPPGMDRHADDLAAELERHTLQDEIDPVEQFEDDTGIYKEIIRQPVQVFTHHLSTPEGREDNAEFVKYVEDVGGIPEPQDEPEDIPNTTSEHGTSDRQDFEPEHGHDNALEDEPQHIPKHESDAWLKILNTIHMAPAGDSHAEGHPKGTHPNAGVSEPGPFPGTVRTRRVKRTNYPRVIDVDDPQISDPGEVDKNTLYILVDRIKLNWSALVRGMVALAFVWFVVAGTAYWEERDRWLAANHSTYMMFVDSNAGSSTGIILLTILGTSYRYWKDGTFKCKFKTCY